MSDDEESEGSVYKDSKEELVEDDEISPEEEGFMQGYNDADENDEKEAAEKEEE